MASSLRWREFLPEVVFYGISGLLGYYLVQTVLSRLDPEASTRGEARQKASAASARLSNYFAQEQDRDGEGEDGERRGRIEELELTQFEQNIAMEVVAPSEIPVSFDDIGGLDDIIEELREAVIYPLTMPHLYSNTSSLLSAPSGVLLHGPPGCGKTMLAKALAHESGACFINLQISTLTEKWYGDSNKLVNAVFTLARKLQPSIVFIDEIDALLGTRRSGEHEASGMVKAEFMTLWDGLTSSNKSGQAQRICILGATNRPQDIDDAILRRMPRKFKIDLPNTAQRRSIYTLTLKGTSVDPDPYKFNLEYLVQESDDLSGSDIKDLCRNAAMRPVREYIREAKARGLSAKAIKPQDVRALQTKDFFGHLGSPGPFARPLEMDVDEELETINRMRGAEKELPITEEEGKDMWEDVPEGSETFSEAPL